MPDISVSDQKTEKNMIKKICFLIGSYNNGGGTERVTSQIADGLAERGFDISIVSIEKGLQPHFETDKRIKLYELGRTEKFSSEANSLAKKLKYKLWCLKKISAIKKSFKKTIRKILPELVIAVDIECYRIIDPFRKKFHYKTIGWEHFALLVRGGRGVDYSRKLAVKHAFKLLVLSDSDLRDYKERYPKAKNLMRIFNPVAFKPTYNSDMNNKVVIAAGRFAAQKNFDALIGIWNKISDKCADWELRIYGDGKDKEKLQSLIEKYGLSNVKLMPYAPRLDEEMDKASIYALSSIYEGFGLVLIEAQAKGLPCVSFNCKHGPSEIITDGVNGFLIEPGDTDGFADKLLKLINNYELRKSFSDNARKDLYRFDVDFVVDQWVEMLESI